MNPPEAIFSHSIFETTNTPRILNKIRLKAIARKAFRNGCDFETMALSLAEDSYFLEINFKFGLERAYQSLNEIIETASS